MSKLYNPNCIFDLFILFSCHYRAVLVHHSIIQVYDRELREVEELKHGNNDLL